MGPCPEAGTQERANDSRCGAAVLRGQACSWPSTFRPLLFAAASEVGRAGITFRAERCDRKRVNRALHQNDGSSVRTRPPRSMGQKCPAMHGRWKDRPHLGNSLPPTMTSEVFLFLLVFVSSRDIFIETRHFMLKRSPDTASYSPNRVIILSM